MTENTADTILSPEFNPYVNSPGLIISALGVVSNVFLLVAFLKDPLKCFRNSGTYLVMNLTVSDSLTCLMSLYYNITPTVILYPIFYSFLHWIGNVSFISITSISIDRFLIVAYPIKHRILMKGHVMILWIAAIWIVSCSIPLLQMLSNSGSGKQEVYPVSLFIIILSAVFYSSTYYKLKKQSRNISLQNSTEGRAHEIRILKEKRFLTTIIIIACIAVVCTLPFLVLYLLRSYLGIPNLAFFMSYIICASIFQANFAVNPLVYILRLPNYRKAFYLLYCRRVRV